MESNTQLKAQLEKRMDKLVDEMEDVMSEAENAGILQSLALSAQIGDAHYSLIETTPADMGLMILIDQDFHSLILAGKRFLEEREAEAYIIKTVKEQLNNSWESLNDDDLSHLKHNLKMYRDSPEVYEQVLLFQFALDQ